MKKQQVSDPELTITALDATELDSSDLELDDPFVELSWSTPPAKSPTLIPVRMNTPNGDELCDPSWCEEPTRVMSKEETDRLLEQVRESQRLEQLFSQGIHTRPTVRSMQAVSMPPSRPVPEVTVVEAAQLQQAG